MYVLECLMGCQQLIKNIFNNIYLCLKNINFGYLLLNNNKLC